MNSILMLYIFTKTFYEDCEDKNILEIISIELSSKVDWICMCHYSNV
jgi:hypothetical protein